ncbi:hypothetical protein L210DRAFT_3767202 [Boletus edulis BED1]|uniref:Uncharacterized protein n=1 Tax=Boletus edulis BED1 TaxID=1328754 RepID=A0AAD4BCJ2_BOLED|nr:hypothetical protein L210DRAFT_3767202 [Boletus edulis BED1]
MKLDHVQHECHLLECLLCVVLAPLVQTPRPPHLSVRHTRARKRQTKMSPHRTDSCLTPVFGPACSFYSTKVTSPSGKMSLPPRHQRIKSDVLYSQWEDCGCYVFPSTSLPVLTEVLKGCLRLRSQLLTPENNVPAMLDYSRDGEHSLSTSAMLKRRIQALVLFVSTSLTPSELDAPTNGEGGNTTDVITHLLDLATPPTGDAPEDDVVTIVAAAQFAIEHIMNVISSREFLGASPDDLFPRSKPERLASFPPGSRWSSKVCAKNVKQRLLNSLA